MEAESHASSEEHWSWLRAQSRRREEQVRHGDGKPVPGRDPLPFLCLPAGWRIPGLRKEHIEKLAEAFLGRVFSMSRLERGRIVSDQSKNGIVRIHRDGDMNVRPTELWTKKKKKTHFQRVIRQLFQS